MAKRRVTQGDVELQGDVEIQLTETTANRSDYDFAKSQVIQVHDGDLEEDDPMKGLSVPFWTKFVAFVLIILLGGAVLICSVLTKTTFTAITSRIVLNSSSRSDGFAASPTTESIKTSSVAFVQVVLILCTPQVFTTLRSFLVGVAGKSTTHFPWPKASSLAVGIIASIFESAAMSAFALLVATRLDPSNTILLCSGIFTGTALSRVFCSSCSMGVFSAKKRGYENINLSMTKNGSKLLQKFCYVGQIIALVLHVGGLSGTVAYTCVKRLDPVAGITAIICTIILSTTWSLCLQKFIFASSTKLGTSSTGAAYPASRKGGFVYALVRLLFIPPFCAIIAYTSWRVDSNSFVIDLEMGFTSWTLDESLAFCGCILGAIFTYFFSLMSLWSTYQVRAFTIPLLLATPASIGWYWLSTIKAIQAGIWPYYPDFFLKNEYVGAENGFLTLILISVWVSMIVILSPYIWKSPKIPVSREQTLYLSPYYDGVFVDSFLLLNRCNGFIPQSEAINNDPAPNAGEKSDSPSTIFICSTMYHEREHEMRQMLRSIRRIALGQKLSKETLQSTKTGIFGDKERNKTSKPIEMDRKYESHVFFDGAIQGGQLNEYALQLLYLIEDVFGLPELKGLKKYSTPYGYQFIFPQTDNFPIPFHVHLKDSTKIKNKKRWSQIMYMKYILDFRKGLDPCNSFILTTDADIDFTVESVEALLDFLARDEAVGAVCARTHPKGSGPVAWYQIFEYAFGHWFQKSAEHVLGCVLCCPGCFSAFRVSAIKDVVTQYQANVNGATDFLTKDMGEDRWLCTLLIRSKYRLEYAAYSSNTTFCPDSFNEFYNQRRRWVPSTLANLFDLVSSPATTTNNDSISYLFIIYQLIIIFATAVSPSTVILIIASGMQSAYSLNATAVIVVLSLVTIFYGLVCLYTPERFQLLVAKVLTFIFACIMASAFVGIYAATIESLPGISDYNMIHWLQPTINSNFTNASAAEANARKNKYLASLPNQDNPHKLPISLDAVYLITYMVIIFVAGFLHPGEYHVLIHFIWYVLGLPSGYLLLLIYSACNLNTRSWGTRVDATTDSSSGIKWKVLWGQFLSRMKECCMYCLRKPSKKEEEEEEEEENNFSDEEELEVHIPETKMKPEMKNWLKDWKCDRYIENFEKHGYTRLSFLEGMTIEDLKAIGIKKKGFQERLVKAIRQRPTTLPKSGVAKDVPEFLRHLHLNKEYTNLFKEYGYELDSDVDNLLNLTERDLVHMGVTKRAHLKQLLMGIQRLKYPSSRDLLLRKIKAEIDDRMCLDLAEHESEQVEFWNHLVGKGPSKQLNQSGESIVSTHSSEGTKARWNSRDKGLLKPEAPHLNPKTDVLKKQLEHLRTSTVVALLLINIIWMSLILSVQLPFLEQWGIQEEAFPILFLAIYFVVLAIQFVALLVHRMETLLHILARAYLPQKAQRNYRGAEDFEVA